MMDWSLTNLPMLCAGAAVLELDVVHIGQWMISRPLVFGPIIGWFCGNVGLGLRFGVLIELLVVKELPIGNALPLNGAFATASAVLLSAGGWHVDPAAAFPAGLLLGGGHRRLENRMRAWRSRFTQVAEGALDSGSSIPFFKIFAYSLGGHAAMTAAFLYAAIVVLGPALSAGWFAAPELLRVSLRWSFQTMPWMGLAALVQAFWK